MKPKLIQHTSSTGHYAATVRESPKRRFSPDRSRSLERETVELRHVSKHPRASSAAGTSFSGSPYAAARAPPPQRPNFTAALRNVDCDEGHRAHFECIANIAASPDLAVEWFKDGVPLKLGKLFHFVVGKVKSRLWKRFKRSLYRMPWK